MSGTHDLWIRGGTIVDGTGAPANVARDPNAARDYAVSATCLAQCTSEDQICRGTAMTPEDRERCADTLTSCREACGR